VRASLLSIPTSDVAKNKAAPASTPATGLKAADRNTRLWNWVNRFEWIAVLMVALLAVALHVRFVTHVGGLWRDEANSVHLATLPTLGQVWHFLDYDSFPILFFAVLRIWSGVFGSYNDAALRALGCITGLGVLGALWLNARAFGVRRPVLSLALIGLNPMVIRYGDSTRAYGLGIVLILLTFGSFWRLVDSPSPPSFKRVLAAIGLALLSVQCLYYNSVLLLAIAAGAIVVALRARAWRTAGIVLTIGLIAAASLLPYAPIMWRMHEWTFLVSFAADFPWLWKRVCEVLGSPDPLGVWLWVGLFFASVGLVIGFAGSHFWHGFSQAHNAKDDPGPAIPTMPPVLAEESLSAPVLFATVALAVGVVIYAGFLRALHYYTQPWYYITLVAFVACALDITFGAWSTTARFQVCLALRSVRLIVALVLLCIAGLPAWEEMPTRHTNVDLLAARLWPLTTKGDLILVPRWECAIPLYRYYRGPAEIVSLPPIADHRFHRYDLVLQQMMTANAMQPLLTRLEEVLRSGRHVFMAGTLPFPEANVSIPIPPPAYHDPSGRWHGASYYMIWQTQVGQFLRAHATRVGRIEVPVPGKPRVQEFENLELISLQAWR